MRTILDGFLEAYPLTTVLHDPACSGAACPALSPSALALAAGADVVIAVLGTTGFFQPGTNNESAACGCPLGNSIEGECCDRTSTLLPGQQLALLTALAALGKPLLLILNSGGILGSDYAAASPAVPAVLHAPFLGMSAGVGVARVVSGAAPPSGRTTLSWYTEAAAAALPPLGDYSDASLYARTYRYAPPAAILWPFGYGLAYTTFEYSALAPGAPSVAPCSPFTLTLTLRNTGSAAGAEVVQAYGTLANSTAQRVPRRQLLAFTKVWLEPGQSRQVSLVVPPEAHAVVLARAGARAGEALQAVVEPGRIELLVAGSSDPEGHPGSSGGGVRGSIDVVGAARPLDEC